MEHSPQMYWPEVRLTDAELRRIRHTEAHCGAPALIMLVIAMRREERVTYNEIRDAVWGPDAHALAPSGALRWLLPDDGRRPFEIWHRDVTDSGLFEYRMSEDQARRWYAILHA